MPVMDFIRGKDKRPHMLLDLDTMTIIPNVKSADPEKGEYVVFSVNSHGRLNEPLAFETRRGNIRVLKVVHDGDYRILNKK